MGARLVPAGRADPRRAGVGSMATQAPPHHFDADTALEPAGELRTPAGELIAQSRRLALVREPPEAG